MSAPTVQPVALTFSKAKTQHSVKQSESVTDLVANLSQSLDKAIDEIQEINSNSHLLSINARIEAARAGTAGAAFGVVAQMMQELSAKTYDAANSLATSTRQTIGEMIDLIGNRIRGTRLSDLALVNIDLIDRNLYERTCDVRWWATDSSLVDALAQPTDEARKHASSRMGVILNAYTVYFDLVLCDLTGRVIANGRPEKYASAGMDQSQQPWFKAALSTASGDEFGFQTAHRSKLVADESVLIYSCTVRERGQANGRPLGVLGVVFNWAALAQTIVERVPLADNERKATRSMIVDSTGAILADSWGKQLQETFSIAGQEQLFAGTKNFATGPYNGHKCCIAHAKAPGFETYSTGWHSLIIQPLDM